MNKQTKQLRLPLIICLAFLLMHGCATESVVPNITPQASLSFTVQEASGNTVEGAVVRLFPFKSQYEDYKSANQDGLSSIDANTSLPSGITGADGTLLFDPIELQGNGFASGNTWIFRPNPIYLRVEAYINGEFVSNDNDPESQRIAFGELESGAVVTVETLSIVGK